MSSENAQWDISFFHQQSLLLLLGSGKFPIWVTLPAKWCTIWEVRLLETFKKKKIVSNMKVWKERRWWREKTWRIDRRGNPHQSQTTEKRYMKFFDTMILSLLHNHSSIYLNPNYKNRAIFEVLWITSTIKITMSDDLPELYMHFCLIISLFISLLKCIFFRNNTSWNYTKVWYKMHNDLQKWQKPCILKWQKC